MTISSEVIKKEQETFHSAEEINAMIPSLEKGFYKILQMNTQVNRLIKYLREDNINFSETDLNDEYYNKFNDQSIDYISSLKVLFNAIQDEIITISKGGGIVNNIEEGIVTWLGKIEDKEFFFSWKIGEKSISYWQEKTSPKQRKPLEELMSG